MSTFLDSALARAREIEGSAAPEGGAAPPDDGAFSQGLRSGWTGLKGEGHAFLGGLTEPFAPDYARDQYAQSKALQEQAATEAPKVNSFDQVTDLRSGFDYGLGKLGQMIPGALPAVGAMIATRGRSPILASTAATIPSEMGGAIQAQQNDPIAAAKPVSERLSSALGTGTAASLVENAVPGYMAGKLMNKGVAAGARQGLAPIIGRNIAEGSAGQAVAATGAEAIRQGGESDLNPDRDTSGDAARLKEAAIGGAVIGAPFGALGAAGEALHRPPRESAPSAPIDAAKNLVASAKDKITGLFTKESSTDDAIARRVEADLPIDPLPPGADPNAHVEKSDAKAVEWATAKAKSWIESDYFPQAMKERAAELLPKIHEFAARQEIAAMDLSDKAVKQGSAFYQHMAEKSGTLKAAGDKISEGTAALLGTVKEAVASFDTQSVIQKATQTRDAALSLLKSKSLPPETKANLQAAADNVQDRSKQLYVAAVAQYEKAMASAKDGTAQEAIKKKLAEIDKWANNGAPPDKLQGILDVASMMLFSKDYAGPRKIISDELTQAIKSTRPELVKNADALRDVSEGIRLYMDEARKGAAPEKSSTTRAYIRSLLGDQAVPFLDNLHTKLYGDTDHKDFYKSLASLDTRETNHKSMADVVRENKLPTSDADVNATVPLLRRYTRGDHVKDMSPEKTQVREKAFRSEIEKHFGKNTDKVLKAFQKEHEASGESPTESRATPRADSGDDRDHESSKNAARGGIAEHTLEATDLSQERPRYYAGKGGAFVLSHEAHVREYGHENSQAAGLLEHATKQNEDRSVSFVKAADFMKERREAIQHEIDNEHSPKKIEALKEKLAQYSDEELHAATNGKPEDYGVVAAGGQKIEGRITHDEARAMLLDTKRFPKSESRISTDKHNVTLDAVRITQETKKKLPYIDGEGDDRRTARAFMEGLASVMKHYGAGLEKPLPDDLVILRRAGGGVMTFGEAKKLSSMRDPLTKKAGRDEHLMKELDEYSKEELTALHKDAIDARDEFAQRGADVLAKGKERLAERLERELDSRKVDDNRDGREADSTLRDNVHEAALVHGKDGKLQQKVGLDDNPLNARKGDPLKAERIGLEKSVEGKPLKDIMVNMKLADEHGTVLDWKGDAKEHPGRMSAEDALTDIHQRKKTLDLLMACLKG